MKQNGMPLDSEAFLEEFLLSERVDEEALDFVATHGFLTALAISPEKVSEQQWMESLFNTEPKWQGDSEKQQVHQALQDLRTQIDREINEDEDLNIPCELELGKDPDESALRAWAFGFMEAVFLNEPAWFSDNEQEVSELLLPVMLASGLFDDEAEFREMLRDKALVDDMCLQIPDVMVELYLLMRAQAGK